MYGRNLPHSRNNGDNDNNSVIHHDYRRWVWSFAFVCMQMKGAARGNFAACYFEIHLSLHRPYVAAAAAITLRAPAISQKIQTFNLPSRRMRDNKILFSRGMRAFAALVHSLYLVITKIRDAAAPRSQASPVVTENYFRACKLTEAVRSLARSGPKYCDSQYFYYLISSLVRFNIIQTNRFINCIFFNTYRMGHFNQFTISETLCYLKKCFK